MVDDPDTDEEDSAPSLFEQLLDEFRGPWRGKVGDLDEVEIEVPTSATVADLDDVTDPAEILDLLAGEDLADELLDELEDRPAHELTDLVGQLLEHFVLADPPEQGMAAIVDEVDRYGAAIEADLVFSGSGLLLIDWFRQPDRYPWSLLLRLLPRMPESGHYDTARRDDDELAARIDELIDAGQLAKPKGNRPPLLGHTRDRALMQDILDVLRRIEHAEWAASPKFKGKGGRPPKNSPRPVGAMDRRREQQRLERLDDIALAALGHDRFRPTARRNRT